MDQNGSRPSKSVRSMNRQNENLSVRWHQIKSVLYENAVLIGFVSQNQPHRQLPAHRQEPEGPRRPVVSAVAPAAQQPCIAAFHWRRYNAARPPIFWTPAVTNG